MKTNSQKPSLLTLGAAVMLVVVILVALTCRKKATASNDPVPEPTEVQVATEVVPVEQEMAIEVVSAPVVVDTSIAITEQRGSFAFGSSTDQRPTPIPEAQIRELIEAQKRKAAEQQ
jgi:hypothetical protein